MVEVFRVPFRADFILGPVMRPLSDEGNQAIEVIRKDFKCEFAQAGEVEKGAQLHGKRFVKLGWIDLASLLKQRRRLFDATLGLLD